MDKATAAILVVGILLAACASPTPEPPATLAVQQAPAEPTATPLPTSTAAPSATPTITPASEGCVRATTEIPEGQNPTRFTTSGAASGCYDTVGAFLDDIGLTWEEFAPGTEITFWTQWPVDPGGALIPPTPTPVPLSVTISPSIEDGFEYVCGHPPFTVDFSAQVSGGRGDLQYAWDFNVDGAIDATAQDPEPFTYQTPRVYNARLTVTDEAGLASVTERRIVVIGEPVSLKPRYGVHQDLAWAPSADVPQMGDLMGQVGIEIVRMDFRWYMIEPTDNSWRFGVHDRVVGTMQSREIGILGLLDDVPSWANGKSGDWSGAYPPTELAQWGDYVYHVVSHFEDSVRLWEVWNEENLSQFFQPNPDPRRYANMLRTAYCAAKYACPDCLVLLGGLAGNGVDMGWEPAESRHYLSALYSSGARPYFDVVAIHPYLDPRRPDAKQVLRSAVEATKAVMDANGDIDKRIWVTEIGQRLIEDIDENTQAQWLTSVYEELGGLPFTGPVFWFCFRDFDTGLGWGEETMGLVSYALQPKPAYYAYQEFIRQHPAP